MTTNNELYEYLETTNLNNNRKQLIIHLADDSNYIIDNDIKRALQVTSNFEDDDYIKLKNTLNYEARHELMIQLEANGLKRDFIKLYTSLKRKATLDDLMKNANIFDLVEYDNCLDNTVVTEILRSIINMTTRDNGLKGIGKGEIFFNLFIEGNQIDGKKNGDVVIEGKSIEVKAYSTMTQKNGSIKNINGGRLMGNNNKIKDPKDIVKKIKELFKGYFINGDVSFLDNVKSKDNKDGYCTSSAKNIQKIYEYLAKNTTLDSSSVFNKLAEAMYFQFFDDFEKGCQYDMFIKTLSNKLDVETIGETLINIHAVLAIISYKMHEKWDYLLVLNTKNGKYDYINGEIVEINNINNLYINIIDRFVFGDGPSNTPGANKQNYVATIYLKN